MTTEVHTGPEPVPPKGKVERGARRKLSYPMILLIIAGALVLLSLVRALTDTGSLTDTRQWSGALGLAVPIGLAGLGGLWAERAGVINIGLEGMMMLGLFATGWIGWQHGPWWGVLAGVIGGVLGGLVHAIATVTFGVDHIVSGVAINILALGATRYLAPLAFDTLPQNLEHMRDGLADEHLAQDQVQASRAGIQLDRILQQAHDLVVFAGGLVIFDQHFIHAGRSGRLLDPPFQLLDHIGQLAALP
jgi:ABC-type uncharacterized transport system permease subunit